MNGIAIYYVNQHLMDLQDEARQFRLVTAAGKPSLIARLVAALRSASGARPTNASPTAASAA
jgi:hypothetical protein